MFGGNVGNEIFSSCALKEKRRGRASGGLATLVKRQSLTQAYILDSSNIWLFTRVMLGKENFIIGNLYFPTNVFNEFCIASLGDLLTDLTENNSENVKLIITGYFNAKIGKTSMLQIIFCIFDFSLLKDTRSSDTPASYSFIA